MTHYKISKIWNLKILLFICLVPVICFGQSMDNLETKLKDLQKIQSVNVVKLDSLKIILGERARLISNAKNNPEVNEEDIINLMANSVTISNEVKKQTGIIDKLNDEINGIRSTLFYRYSKVLDSLNSISSNANIDQIILEYTEKKLRVSPRIGSLSFNPEKILNINLSKNIDSIERTILMEYIENALNEVNDYLARIENENEEVEEIFALQRKTQRFLEEAEFDRTNKPINFVSDETDINGAIDGPGSEGGFFRDNEYQTSLVLTSNLESYSKILSQLSFVNPSTGIDWQSAIESAKENLSLSDYKTFLDELGLRLGEYKLILLNKMSKLNE